jgi:hypothetical protein
MCNTHKHLKLFNRVNILQESKTEGSADFEHGTIDGIWQFMHFHDIIEAPFARSLSIGQKVCARLRLSACPVQFLSRLTLCFFCLTGTFTTAKFTP